VLLYFHGGGYVVGHPSSERPFIARIADAVGRPCFSVDYRLAPRHRFPAAVDDALSAYGGLLDEGVEPSRIVLVGDSAGGGLALALLLRVHDEELPQPGGAVLISPWLDLTHSGSTLETNSATDYLPKAAGHAASAYLGDADPRHRYASPLFADLSGLPPMLVMAGGVEMLLSDSTRFAERAVAAGVDITLHVEPDMYHVWPAILPRHPASVRAIDLAAGWIRSVVESLDATK
jgi:monoterpene epsilon-lactone hydrolase